MIGKISKKVRNSMQSLQGSNREYPLHDNSVDGNENLERNIETPRNNDILSGRGRTSWSHTGNQQFRSFVGTYLKQYTETTSRNEKTRIVHLIYDEVIKSGGRFLKLDSNSNTWYQIGKLAAREKIGHTLRDGVGLRIKVNPNDEDDSCFALNSNDSSELRRPEIAANTPGIVPPITESAEVSGNGPRRNATSPCEGDKNSLPFTESSQSEVVSSQNSKSKKYSSANSQLKAKRDHIRDEASSISNHQLNQAIVERRALESCPHIMEECTFDHLVDSVLTDFVLPQDADHMSMTITSAGDEELSTGFSAMSLETPKSGRSGSMNKSKSSTNDGKSAFSILKSTMQSNAIHQKSNHPVVKQTSRSAAQSSMTHHGGSGKPRSDFYEDDCDASMGVNSLDWAKSLGDVGDVCSLDDYSLTSHQTKSTRGSGHNMNFSRIGKTDQSQGSSEKSSESENEWRKTLLALRGT
jgi:hypothetical protein